MKNATDMFLSILIMFNINIYVHKYEIDFNCLLSIFFT